jgi:hypothetical protein
MRKHTFKFGNRGLAVVLSFFLLAVSATVLPASVSAVSGATARKIQQWQRETREIVSFSQRIYRFYKLSSQKTTMQARVCN